MIVAKLFLLIGTASAAVQQTCHGFQDGRAALQVTGQHNASVLIYQLSEALNKTSIPRFVDDTVLDNLHSGLTICTPERMKHGECQGAKLGEFIFEGHEHLTTLFTDMLTFSKDATPTNDHPSVDYINDLGGTFCIVIWRPKGDFSDVRIKEGWGEPPMHWGAAATDTWCLAFVFASFAVMGICMMWCSTFAAAASDYYYGMDTVNMSQNDFVTISPASGSSSGTSRAMVPVLKLGLEIACCGLGFEALELILQAFLTYGEVLSFFKNEHSFAVSSHTVYMLPVRSYFLEICRMHYIFLGLLSWLSYHGSLIFMRGSQRTVSECSEQSQVKHYLGEAGAHTSLFAGLIQSARAYINIFKNILPFKIVRDFISLGVRIAGQCEAALIMYSLLCGWLLLVRQVSPGVKHSRAIWAMYLGLVVGGPLLVIGLLCLCYFGQKYSRGCLFPGHGEMLFINPYLWDYQMAYYHNAFEFQYEDPSKWLLFFNLLPSMIPVIFWNYVAILGAVLFFVIVPHPWRVLWERSNFG